MNCSKMIFAVLGVLSCSALASGPKGVNISGRLIDNSTGAPLSSSHVDFTIKVLSPDNCLLYEEKHLAKDLSASGGTFSLTLGEGSSPYNPHASAGNEQTRDNILKVFSNSSGALSGLTSEAQGTESTVCTGTYSPVAGDQRKVKIIFDPGSGGPRVIFPYHKIASVPYAQVAEESSKAADSDKLGGEPAASFARVSDLTASVPANETDPTVRSFAKAALPACGAGQVLKSDGTAFSCVTDNAGGTPAAATTSSTGVVQVGTGLAVNGSGLLSVDVLPISKITGLQAALDSKLSKSYLPECSANQTIKWVSASDTLSCANISLTASSVSDFATAVDARIAALQPGDASYATKGVVQFNTNAATSGINVMAGVASVNAGVGANQIVQLDAASKLPAVDGSALTNLNATNLSSGTMDSSLLPVVSLSKGGTGATTAAAARTSLELGSAAQATVGSASGNVPPLGIGGLVANKACAADGTGSSIICNSTMVTSIDGLSDASTPESLSVFLGAGAGVAATGGGENTAVGVNALATMTAGWDNTAVGLNAMTSLTTGYNNISVGMDSLRSLTTGYENSALGMEALRNLTTGTGNTALGWRAMYAMTTNYANVAIGDGAAYSNTGTRNVSVGSWAFQGSATGSRNAVVGESALSSAALDDNTAIGQAAGKTATGSQNVFVGASAGADGVKKPASSNILIGYNVQVPANGTSNHLNIGGALYGDLATGKVGVGIASPTEKLQVAGNIAPSATNTYSLGTASLLFSTVYAQNGTINTSDRRMKKDIQDIYLGLDFINRLRPVSYRWNAGTDLDEHYGLIAQEAEQTIVKTQEAAKRTPAGQGIVSHDKASDRYGIRYTELIAPMIKAIQEVYGALVNTQSEVATLKAENAAMKSYLCEKDKEAPFCQ